MLRPRLFAFLHLFFASTDDSLPPLSLSLSLSSEVLLSLDSDELLLDDPSDDFDALLELLRLLRLLLLRPRACFAIAFTASKILSWPLLFFACLRPADADPSAADRLPVLDLPFSRRLCSDSLLSSEAICCDRLLRGGDLSKRTELRPRARPRPSSLASSCDEPSTSSLSLSSTILPLPRFLGAALALDRRLNAGELCSG